MMLLPKDGKCCLDISKLFRQMLGEYRLENKIKLARDKIYQYVQKLKWKGIKEIIVFCECYLF